MMRFVPNFRIAQPANSSSWWALYPELLVEFLGVLGFEKTEVTLHSQKYVIEEGQNERKVKLMKMFTVVGTRTREQPAIQPLRPR